MDNYLDINKDWFSKKYLPLLGRRFWTFKVALNLFKQLKMVTIVETGCIRKKEDWDAGYSTMLWAEYAFNEGATVHSIDISPDNILLAGQCLGKYKAYVDFKCGDSVAELKKWKGLIDLLYLDSVDCDPKDEKIALKAQKHQLEEIKTALPLIPQNGIVLLDDNYYPNGGKTKLAKEFLTEKKFICLLDYEQSLWIRTK
jgi:hypothetical protein